VELLVASKGGDGWDQLLKARPDVLLLDLDLPDVPGTKILDSLKEDPRLKDTAVVVVSADATPKRIQKLKAAGACAYLTKPLEVTELLDTIDALLRGEVEKNCA
jgi:DNA-binding NarL/FixJ family response regulator